MGEGSVDAGERFGTTSSHGSHCASHDSALDMASGAKVLDRCFPQVRRREHQGVSAPALVSDDGNTSESVAVMDVEREIVPPRAWFPALERVQHHQQSHGVRAADAHLLDELILGPVQVCLAQDTADVEPEGIRTFASQCDWHDSGSLRRGSPRP